LLLFFKKEGLAYLSKARKFFFFEKKKQKTFIPWRRGLMGNGSAASITKS